MIVGLTGGVASGKSTVEALLREAGVAVIDADQVAREVVAPGEPALAAIAEAFGAEVLQADGSLDRARLRRIVFADAEARRRLEALTHPAIEQRLRQWAATRPQPYGVLSAAILIESRFRDLCDRVLVVDVPEATQIARLTARDGIDETLARQMLAAQASREQRLAAADDVIVNDGDLAQLAVRTRAMDAAYRRLAAAH